ncbi:MAG TPA: GNAT family N-acetyltransferase, partial [Propionibacteriaceae bacterium]|nr:GNAT family N-acetyltransferase [Propionibacteriaceae bacterium]
MTLRHDAVILAPLRHRDGGAWERVRRANAEWLRPWEATLPPGSELGPSTYAGLVRSLTKQARDGRMLPWLVWYEPTGDRGRG